MPRNGIGQYVAPLSSWNPAIDGNLASSADWNFLLSDMQSAITQSVSSDGQTPFTGPLNMGGNQIRNVGAPTGLGQALRRQQLTQGADIASAATVVVPDEGSIFNITGTTQINTFGPSFAGRRVLLRFASAGLRIVHSPAAIVLPGGVDIVTSAGQYVEFVYGTDGTWAAIYGDASQFNVAGLAANKSLIEVGSNANGRWIRFADGTQICFTVSPISLAGTSWISAPGGFSYLSLGAQVIPAAFVGNAPTCVSGSFSENDVSGRSAYLANISAPTTTQFPAGSFLASPANSAPSGGSGIIRLTTLGRWKA